MRTGARPLRNLLIVSACLVAFLGAAGCAGKSRRYAQEARSSYISARAVLVGVQEFPARMEKLLRSSQLESMGKQGRELAEDARNLLDASTSAFQACEDKCRKLQNEGGKKFAPYAEKLLELVNLNRELMSSYSDLIRLSQSLMEYQSFLSNPALLMPELNRLDTVAAAIEEQRDRLHELESEAERLYLSLTE